MNDNEMEVGQFAERNHSIVYRYKNHSGKYCPWEDGIITIQKHNSVAIETLLSQEIIKDQMVNSNGAYPWETRSLVFLIEKPQKKHVDNAIKLLGDMLKDNKIDGLSYIENLNILKKYLKTDIIVKEKN